MLEILIVAVLVLWSAIVVFKKVFPQTSTKLLSLLALQAEQKEWLVLAKWLKPVTAAGCGGSCGCSQSEDTTAKKADLQAVKWK